MTLTAPGRVIATLLGLHDRPEMTPRYNIAPTQQVLTVRQSAEGTLQGEFLRWGLVPSWARDLSFGARAINARVETAAVKPTFRHAFRQRRCVVVADGYYEWRKEGKSKQPYYFHLKEFAPFTLAGLWERWRSPSGEEVDSVTLLTTEANDQVRSIHDRMPILVPAAQRTTWLNPNLQATEDLHSFLQSVPAPALEFHPVSPLVNKPGNDVPRCIAAV
jgi:putative SOS response-associated peptidase YedK